MKVFRRFAEIKKWALFSFFITFIPLAVLSQTTLNTTAVSGFANNNGSGTVTFNFQNTNSYAVTITEIEGISGTSGTATTEVWVNPTPVNSSTSPSLATTAGWSLAAKGTATVTGNTTSLTTQILLTNISVVIPGNTTVGMAICIYSGTSTYQRYHTMVSPNIPLTTVSGGGCNILMGTNISWGGGIPPTSPGNHPRGWLGKITFVGKNLSNDAGISLINTPTATVTPGTYNVTATVKNFGVDTLKSAGLRWSVNGNLQTSPSNWTGSLVQNSTDGPITFGSFNFTAGTHILKVWTVNPNGIQDSNNKNDTATLTIVSCNPASGTYVIDKAGTGDFRTFNEAANYLKNCGISGPVKFRVKSGVYSENLELTNIAGVSPTNTVTFESYNLDSTSVVLTYAAAGTADNFVLRFNGAKYFTFRNMTIQATGSSYGRGVEFITAASYNNLTNNVIQTLITTSSNHAGIYSYTTLDQYNLISYNRIIGGYYGIYWYGVSSSSRELGNIIEGNTITDFYYYGILSYYQDAIKIRKNTVTNGSASGSVYGIYSYYSANAVDISYNKITLKATSTMYGLYLNNNVGTSTLRGKVANNFVSTGGTSTGTIYALYLSTVSYHDVSFNNVVVNNASTTGRSLYITGGTASSTTVRNNIFANLGGGFAIYAGSATSSLGTCDYNNLYTSGAVLAYWTANRADLAAWRTISSKDANSVSIAPGFYSPEDLHVNNAGLSGKGIAISGITDDVDGETRLNPPDIGADEFSLTSNDAGVSALISPLYFCPGSPNGVSVKVKNFGIATLSSVTVNWEINGVAQTPQTFSVSLTQYQEATVSLGSYSFSAGISYDFAFWTTMPNNITDENKLNDKFIYKNLSSVLSGNYTIGSISSNYLNFNEAINDLKSKGVCGPVVFKVTKGIYKERIVIPSISGASPINTITFDGTAPDSVTLSFAGTSTLLSTVLLNGADYITIKNMTIENTGTTYSVGATLMNAADFNTFDNCAINVYDLATGTTSSGIIATSTETSATGYSNNANYTKVNNCKITGGYYGVRFNGTSTSVKCMGNTVTNCTFNKVYYYGIYYYYTTMDTINNNYIANFRNSTCYGIYHYYGGDNEQIIGNTMVNAYYGIYDYYVGSYGELIGNRATGAYYGLYHYATSAAPSIKAKITDNYITATYMGMYIYYHNGVKIERNYVRAGYVALYHYYENYSGDDSSFVYNNMLVEGGGTYTYGYGMLLSTSKRVNIYHNTMQTDTNYTSSSTYGACRVQSCTGNIKVKNNIFRTMGTNMSCFSSDGNGIIAGEIDYNIYYSTMGGNPVAYWGSTTYTNYYAWAAAVPSQNRNSQYMDPMLISKYDLHLKPNAPFLKGKNLKLDVDKDKDPRCVPVPTIGADEFKHPYEKPTAGFYVDSLVCNNSPYTFYNSAGIFDPKLHWWFVNGNFKSNSVNFTYLFTKTGIDTVTLVTQNCSSSDTVSKIINIKSPNTPPVSYFVADKNYVEIYEDIQLTNLSTNCPERYKWKIMPDSVFDPTIGSRVKTYSFTTGNDSSFAPVLTFLYSDKYTVCLTTYNSFDTGTTYCLNKYIEVKPAAILCVFPFDTKEQEGVLYDDGGFVNAYSPNKSCGFNIHPCGSEVKVVFKSFDISADDYLRIFEGDDAKGKPLWDASLYPNGLNNGTQIPNAADTFVSRTGKVYIDLISNASTQGNGFVANWFSVKEYSPKPVASFEISDTVCQGIPVIFHNTSTGTQISANWDWENDWFFDDTKFDGETTFLGDGLYRINLVVTSCGGSDTFSRSVYAHTATMPPNFELLASNKRPNIFNEIVTISENTLVNCVDSAIWTITPNKYTLLVGDLNKSKVLSMKFNDTTCYDFSVIGSYMGMADTLFFPCFIKPILYCKPVVTTLSSDIGISKVIIGKMTNVTDIGIREYSDYSSLMLAELERGAPVNFTISRKTNLNPINRKIWIDLNDNGVYDDLKELVAKESYSNSLDWKGSFYLPANLKDGSYKMRIGASFGNSPNTPCGPNLYGEFEDYRIKIIDDISKPVITLNGSEVINISACDRLFTDPGATAFDNVDGNLTDSIIITGSFNPNLAGDYFITYDVKDKAGNIADQVSRTITVSKETVPPELSLFGNPIENIQVFNTYSDLGFTVKDTCSGLDTVLVENNVDTAILGSYQVKYTAYDIEGNSSIVTRTVNIIDTIAPVLTSKEKDTIVVNVLHMIAQPLFDVTDNYYPDVDVTIIGTYFTNFPNGEANKLGYYTLIYHAEDGSGNFSNRTFVIKVVDKEKPQFRLKGDGIVKVCLYDTLMEPGYILIDNFDPKPKVVRSGTYVTDYLVNKGVGNYDLIYTAIDNSGNKSSAFRYILVSDIDSCFSSINNQQIAGNIILYPNPGNGDFNIAFSKGSQKEVPITIYNSLGEVVYQTSETIKAGDIKSFDKQNLKVGIYYIRIYFDGELVSLKYSLIN